MSNSTLIKSVVIVLAMSLPVGLALAADSKTSSSKLSSSDSAFIKEAAQGGMMEVELGKAAQDKASNEKVKDFGKRMEQDHSKANDELKSWASSNNVTLPTEENAQQKAMHDKLAKMSGDAFDRAYASHMVADHAKAVGSFQHASKTAANADLKAWAAKTLPTLEEHQKQARTVNAKVKGGTAAKTDTAPKK